MATLQELNVLFNDSDLQEKVESALVIATQAVLDGTPTADEQTYAGHVFNNIKSEGRKALASVLAANNTATVGQITGASDVAIQTNVTAVVSTLSVAYNAQLVAGGGA